MSLSPDAMEPVLNKKCNVDVDSEMPCFPFVVLFTSIQRNQVNFLGWQLVDRRQAL